tara:strand:+ start:990 stop:1637 length:648 start_codon:yes stop_codon:yes gene_type:complete
MSSKIIYGLYGDDDQLLEATKKIVSKGHRVNEVYSPYPVHGLDTAMGLKYSRMAVTSFLFGMMGAFLITLLIWFVMIDDWPLVIGGKPNFTYGQNLPAFIPVTFEATVFCAAHLMVLTFLFRCGLFPGSSSRNPDPRTTDDKFLMEIHESDSKKITEIKKIMKETGAEEIKVKNNENELLEEFEEIRKKQTKKIMKSSKNKQSFMKTIFNKILKK